MNKIPQWFNLEHYQQELTPMDWAFEIFIRLYTEEKLTFILNNFPYSNSPARNAVYLLSCSFPKFNFDEAMSFVEKEKTNVYENILAYYSADHVQALRESPDSRLELMILNKCIKRFRKVELNYIAFLRDMPIHMLFEETEKQHLKERFNQIHKTVAPAPLIFKEQEIFEHYGNNEWLKNAKIKQPKAHTKRSNNPTRPFRMNLAFTDGEILGAVEQYLKEIRPVRALGKSKLLKKLPNWRTNHVLAIRDLTEWGEKWNKEKLTYAEIANAVWPPFTAGSEKIIDYVERVRKTSIPDIHEAFTEMTYSLLLEITPQPE